MMSENQATIVRTGGNIEKGQFVGTLLIVSAGNLHRVARIAQGDKIDSFDNPSTGDIQTGNDAFGQAHAE